jgi:hypothetical protein
MFCDIKPCSPLKVNLQRTTQHYIQEDTTLHNHRCEKVKSIIVSPLQKLLLLSSLSVEKKVMVVILYLCCRRVLTVTQRRVR